MGEAGGRGRQQWQCLCNWPAALKHMKDLELSMEEEMGKMGMVVAKNLGKALQE